MPAPVDASKLNLARYGGEKLVNCKVVKDERKLADSALKSPVATEETYLGMPVTKMEVSNGTGGAMFVDLTTKQEGVSSRSFFCRVENYVRDGVHNENTMAISSDSTFCLPSMADRTFWTYIEVRHLDSGVYICVAPLLIKQMLIDPRIYPGCLRLLLILRKWNLAVYGLGVPKVRRRSIRLRSTAIKQNKKRLLPV